MSESTEDAIAVRNNNTQQDNNNITLNVFSNTAYAGEENNNDSENHSNSKEAYPPSPNNTHRNTHRSLSLKKSNPPSNPPPVFEVPPSPTQFLSSRDEEEDTDEKEEDYEDNVEYKVVENENKPVHGILRHRSSVRDPSNLTHKTVTFGKLPRRRDEPNPCILLLIALIFLIAMLSFILVLLVIRGSIDVSCSNKNTRTTPTVSCPSSWIVGEKGTCYGVTSMDKLNFTNAKSSCALHGGYLLSLETKSEEEWFNTNILALRIQHQPTLGLVYLGLRQQINGVKLWGSKQPFTNDRYNLSTIQNMTVNGCFAFSAGNDNWKSVNCKEEYSFYCERMAVR